MELLYVWIENYNNIYRQGFNFSPKHKFEFDPTELGGEVIGGLLTHNDINPNYPDNFFGEHISNITAIVGKNGSGKSSLLKLIKDGKSSIKTKTLIIYRYDTAFYFISTIKFTCEITIKGVPLLQDNNQESLKFICRLVFYSPIINSNRNYMNDDFIGNISSMRQFSKSCSDLDSNRNTKKTIESGSIKYHEYLEAYSVQEMTSQIIFVSSLKNKKYLPFKLPTEIKLTFSFFNMDILDDINECRRSNYDIILLAIISALNKKNQDKEILKSSLIYVEADVYSLKKNLNNICKTNHYDYTEILKFVDFLHDKEYSYEESRNGFILIFNIMFSEINQLNIFHNRPLDSSLLSLDLQKQWANDVGLCIAWRDISDGESYFLSFVSRLLNYLRNSKLPSIVLLDEFELGLHPQWQKEAISKLILFFNTLETKGHHLILTTHSPILLSDLPRENIIFLDTEKDEEGKGWCKVCDPEDMDRTFGANIHTLYRNSFFMQEGLMGEFAKTKIQDVLDCLNRNDDINEDKKKEVRFIISQIGEPLIREMLLKKYDMKFHFNVEDRILTLEKELKMLKGKKR